MFKLFNLFNPTVAVDQTSCSGKLLQIFTPVAEQFFLKILQKTAPRSCDLDPIPTKLLYINLDVLFPCHKYHQHFPYLWCRATRLENCRRQSPAKNKQINNNNKKSPPKKKNVLENYRPISNLPFLSKTLEKVVLHQFLACTSPRKQLLQSFPICLPYWTQHRDRPTSC